jgi:AsmA protein
MAFAVSLCLLFLVAAPYFIGGRHSEFALRSAAVFAASRDSYSLSSPVRLVAAPMIALESGTLSMPQSRSSLGRSGEVIAMLITGSGARMTLENAIFTADFTKSEATFSQETPAGGIAPLVSTFQSMQFSALAVRDSSVHLKMADGSTLVLDDVTADVLAKGNGAIRASGSFTFRGEVVSFETTVGTIVDPQQNARPVAATFSGDLLNARLKGHYTLGESPRLLAPEAELYIPSVRKAALWMGSDWPSGPGFENFLVRGQLEWGGRTLAFQEARVRMDGNDASGTLSVNFSGQRPAVDGTLSLETLDLTKYAQPHDAPVRAGKSLLTMLRTTHRLEFPLIKAVEADLRISSGSIVLPGMAIGKSAATISLKGGKMIADVAELEIDDVTRGGGQLRIDTNGPAPTYDIRGKLRSLDLGPAGRVVFGHPTFEGRGDVTVEVTAHGDDGTSVLKSLAGKLFVTLTEGGRLGIDVDQLVAAASAHSAPGAWQTASSSGMSIDTLDARFALANGVIRTENAEAVAGSRAVKAEGAIDLSAHTLDLELAVGEKPPADSAAPVAQEGQAVDLRGPWVEPKVAPGTYRAPLPVTADPLPNPR